MEGGIPLVEVLPGHFARPTAVVAVSSYGSVVTVEAYDSEATHAFEDTMEASLWVQRIVGQLNLLETG